MLSSTFDLRSAWRMAFSLLALFTVIAAAAGPPRVRETLDFGWRFRQGGAPGADKLEFNDGAWPRVNLPHDWGIEGDFNRTNVMFAASGYLPAGIGWYRRTFTVGDAARIRLTPDHATRQAKGQDLSFVTVEVTDKAGWRQPNADSPITFSISGPGVIAGVGNGSDRS